MKTLTKVTSKNALLVMLGNDREAFEELLWKAASVRLDWIEDEQAYRDILSIHRETENYYDTVDEMIERGIV